MRRNYNDSRRSLHRAWSARQFRSQASRRD